MMDEKQKVLVFGLAALFHAARIMNGSHYVATPEGSEESLAVAQRFVAAAKRLDMLPDFSD